jgi:hypothetical protein
MGLIALRAFCLFEAAQGNIKKLLFPISLALGPHSNMTQKYKKVTVW